jgi:hypothetical protein
VWHQAVRDNGSAPQKPTGRHDLARSNSADTVTNIGDHLVLDLDNMAAGCKSPARAPDPKDHLSTIAIGTNIYFMGDECGPDDGSDIRRSVHVYDTTNNASARLADMPPTYSHGEAGTVIVDGPHRLRGWCASRSAT